MVKDLRRRTSRSNAENMLLSIMKISEVGIADLQDMINVSDKSMIDQATVSTTTMLPGKSDIHTSPAVDAA